MTVRSWLGVSLLAGVAPLAAQQPFPADSAARLVAVASDSSGRVSLEARAAALRTLSGACPAEHVPVLLHLGRPYRQPWVIWRGALTALSACALPELAPMWRELLGFPRRPVRELAIVGVARTGIAADRPMLREATHRETDRRMRALAAWADTLLGLPPAERAMRSPPH